MTTTPTNIRSQGGAETLLPCPFCGAGESRIDHQNMWTGMRNQLVCVHIRHWCEKPSRSHLCITANTEEEAVAEWNKRALAAPASAQEAEEDAFVIERLSGLLAGVAIALKGEELPLHRHSYHDLVELAQTLKLELDLYRATFPNGIPESALASAQPKTGGRD